MACGCAAAVALTAIVAGCGGEENEREGAAVTQRITREFGRKLVAAREEVGLDGNRTVLQLLRNHHDVDTWSERGWLESLEGLKAGERGEAQTSWVLNVNGIEADEAPRDYRLHDGDVVQWDYRDWYTLFSVRATVGAFPETFSRGAFGRRFPTTVECADARARACLRVKRILRRAGVAVDGSRPPGPRPPVLSVRRARVLVGPWKRWRDRPWPARIDRGARYSGVFANFDEEAKSIRLLDWDARTVRSVGAGSGLVAAIRPTEQDLLWVVTGVDAAGVDRAAHALGSDELRDAFALVVAPGGSEKVPLPLDDPTGPRDRKLD